MFIISLRNTVQLSYASINSIYLNQILVNIRLNELLLVESTYSSWKSHYVKSQVIARISEQEIQLCELNILTALKFILSMRFLHRAADG